MIRATRPARLPLSLVLGGALLLGACHDKPKPDALDAIDNQLMNGAATAETNDADGLRTAIRVDPARAHGHPPRAAAAHPTVAASRPAPARAAAGEADSGNCLGRYGAALSFADSWSRRLPPELPLPPQAHLTEAAGHDGGCAIRAASFTVPGGRDALIAFYRDRAHAAGYSADAETRGGDLFLAGGKGPAGFTVIAGTPADGATPVDFIWAKPE